MAGLQILLSNVLKFRSIVKKDLVKQFIKAGDDAHPASVFFTCMDNRYDERVTRFHNHLMRAFQRIAGPIDAGAVCCAKQRQLDSFSS